MRVSACLHGPNLRRRSVTRTRQSQMDWTRVNHSSRLRLLVTRPFLSTPALMRDGFCAGSELVCVVQAP